MRAEVCVGVLSEKRRVAFCHGLAHCFDGNGKFNKGSISDESSSSQHTPAYLAWPHVLCPIVSPDLSPSPDAHPTHWDATLTYSHQEATLTCSHHQAALTCSHQEATLTCF